MSASPGAYLRHLREAARLSLDDVALRTETVPPVSARRRAEWLAEMEANIAPPAPGLVDALAGCFAIDATVLAGLVAEYEGLALWVRQLPKAPDAAARDSSRATA